MIVRGYQPKGTNPSPDSAPKGGSGVPQRNRCQTCADGYSSCGDCNETSYFLNGVEWNIVQSALMYAMQYLVEHGSMDGFVHIEMKKLYDKLWRIRDTKK